MYNSRSKPPGYAGENSKSFAAVFNIKAPCRRVARGWTRDKCRIYSEKKLPWRTSPAYRRGLFLPTADELRGGRRDSCLLITGRRWAATPGTIRREPRCTGAFEAFPQVRVGQRSSPLYPRGGGPVLGPVHSAQPGQASLTRACSGLSALAADAESLGVSVINCTRRGSPPSLSMIFPTLLRQPTVPQRGGMVLRALTRPKILWYARSTETGAGDHK